MCLGGRRSARRAASGFSLLEALAATAVLGVGLLAFTANAVSLTRSAKTADSVDVATALAQQKLEQLRSLQLGSAGHTTGSYGDATTLNAAGTANGPYTRSWTVSAKDTPRFGLKTVTVSVAWTDSMAHTSQVAAYIRCSTVPCP